MSELLNEAQARLEAAVTQTAALLEDMAAEGFDQEDAIGVLIGSFMAEAASPKGAAEHALCMYGLVVARQQIAELRDQLDFHKSVIVNLGLLEDM